MSNNPELFTLVSNLSNDNALDSLVIGEEVFGERGRKEIEKKVRFLISLLERSPERRLRGYAPNLKRALKRRDFRTIKDLIEKIKNRL